VLLRYDAEQALDLGQAGAAEHAEQAGAVKQAGQKGPLDLAHSMAEGRYYPGCS
jgi:hypothetical protein